MESMDWLRFWPAPPKIMAAPTQRLPGPSIQTLIAVKDGPSLAIPRRPIPPGLACKWLQKYDILSRD